MIFKNVRNLSKNQINLWNVNGTQGLKEKTENKGLKAEDWKTRTESQGLKPKGVKPKGLDNKDCNPKNCNPKFKIEGLVPKDLDSWTGSQGLEPKNWITRKGNKAQRLKPEDWNTKDGTRGLEHKD